MEFVKKHPFLILWIAAVIACIFFKVPFGFVALGTLVYILLILLIQLPKTMFFLGYLMQGPGKKPDLAMKMYQYAYDHGARVGAPMIAYGMLLLTNFRYAEGLTVLQDVLMVPNLNPNFLKVTRQDLAIAYYKNDELDKAISTMELMLEEYEYFSGDFYTTLGYFYILAKDYDKATEINEKALSDDPSFGPAYDNLGLIAYEKEDLEEAEELFKKALDLRDTMVSSKYYLGLIAEKRGDSDEASTYFAAAHAGKITGLNTITPEEINEKYKEYCL